MATLYVENVPEDLYDALRSRAQENRKSIAAEVLTLLGENIPTPAEVARRKEILERAGKLRAKRAVAAGPFATAEEMQRDDRSR